MLTEMSNDAAAEKPGSAEHGDGALVRGRHGSNSPAYVGAEMPRPSRLRCRLIETNPGCRAMKRARSLISDNASACFRRGEFHCARAHFKCGQSGSLFALNV